MPKEIIWYICDICEKRHKLKKNAEQCESNHYIPQEVKDVTYDYKDKGEYPSTITVVLGKGHDVRVIKYYRKGCD